MLERRGSASCWEGDLSLGRPSRWFPEVGLVGLKSTYSKAMDHRIGYPVEALKPKCRKALRAPAPFLPHLEIDS
jgi:hypothetical protein